jgi:hypothetical protein
MAPPGDGRLPALRCGGWFGLFHHFESRQLPDKDIFEENDALRVVRLYGDCTVTDSPTRVILFHCNFWVPIGRLSPVDHRAAIHLKNDATPFDLDSVVEPLAVFMRWIVEDI